MRDTIDMARKAGWDDLPTVRLAFAGFDIKAFEALVRADAIADEREACAKMLDDASGTGKIISCTCAAKAIRARGEASIRGNA